MSQESGEPQDFLDRNRDTQTYFSNRISTDVLPAQGVIYRISTIRSSVNFFNSGSFIEKLPFGSYIDKMLGYGTNLFDIVTYDFKTDSTAFASIQKIS